MTKCDHQMVCNFRDLGLIEYQEAWTLQKEIVENVIQGGQQTVLLCEHPAVLTLGRLAAEENILVSQEYLQKQKIQVLRIDRGGEITLHAPGQLVVYPILDLKNSKKDLKLFLEKLQDVVIDLLRDFDIVARGIPGERGVWVEEQKIASIGIGVKKWVSYHGLALNVNTHLNYFSLIKPCGLDVSMTSIAQLTGSPVALDQIKAKMINRFCEHFGLETI